MQRASRTMPRMLQGCSCTTCMHGRQRTKRPEHQRTCGRAGACAYVVCGTRAVDLHITGARKIARCCDSAVFRTVDDRLCRCVCTHTCGRKATSRDFAVCRWGEPDRRELCVGDREVAGGGVHGGIRRRERREEAPCIHARHSATRPLCSGGAGTSRTSSSWVSGVLRTCIESTVVR